MQISFSHYVHPVIGCLQFHFEDEVLVKIDLPSSAPLHTNTITLPIQWRKQFDAYFNGYFKSFFDGDILIQGSEHDRLVWQAMLDTPYGQTQTYGQVAHTIGSSAQAVGQACKRNPVPIIIPCHRIIGQHDLGGYGGRTDTQHVSIKQWLLQHERAHAS